MLGVPRAGNIWVFLGAGIPAPGSCCRDQVSSALVSFPLRSGTEVTRTRRADPLWPFGTVPSRREPSPWVFGGRRQHRAAPLETPVCLALPLAAVSGSRSPRSVTCEQPLPRFPLSLVTVQTSLEADELLGFGASFGRTSPIEWPLGTRAPGCQGSRGPVCRGRCWQRRAGAAALVLMGCLCLDSLPRLLISPQSRGWPLWGGWGSSPAYWVRDGIVPQCRCGAGGAARTPSTDAAASVFPHHPPQAPGGTRWSLEHPLASCWTGLETGWLASARPQQEPGWSINVYRPLYLLLVFVGGKNANRMVQAQTRRSPGSEFLPAPGWAVTSRRFCDCLENVHSVNHTGSSCRPPLSQGASEKIWLICLVW